MILRNRVCVRCGKEYSPDGMTQKYCPCCGVMVREEQRKAHYERRREQREQRRKLTIDAETLKQITPVGAGEWLVGKDHPLSYSMVKKMCKRIAKEISSPVAITPRRFRTTCATDLYEQTKDIKLLQEAGGWASAAIPLKHYAKGRKTTEAASTAFSAVYH